MELLERLRRGLGATRSLLASRLHQAGWTITPASLEEALLLADAGLEVAESLAADLERARQKGQVERYRDLARSESVAAEEFESLQATARALEATVKSDSASLDNARLNLEYTSIRAPIAGRTGSLLIKEGNVVRAQGSGALVTVNHTRPNLVRFAVPAPAVRSVRNRLAM